MMSNGRQSLHLYQNVSTASSAYSLTYCTITTVVDRTCSNYRELTMLVDEVR